MQADTVLAIDKLLISNTGVDAVSDTELDLRQGTIFGNVKKLSATSQYLIKIPNGIAGVRGTTFIIERQRRHHGDFRLYGGFLCRPPTARSPPKFWVLATNTTRPPASSPISRRTELSQAEQTAVSIVTVVEGSHFCGMTRPPFMFSPNRIRLLFRRDSISGP